jgi:hypothetical protein
VAEVAVVVAVQRDKLAEQVQAVRDLREVIQGLTLIHIAARVAVVQARLEQTEMQVRVLAVLVLPISAQFTAAVVVVAQLIAHHLRVDQAVAVRVEEQQTLMALREQQTLVVVVAVVELIIQLLRELAALAAVALSASAT